MRAAPLPGGGGGGGSDCEGPECDDGRGGDGDPGGDPGDGRDGPPPGGGGGDDCDGPDCDDGRPPGSEPGAPGGGDPPPPCDDPSCEGRLVFVVPAAALAASPEDAGIFLRFPGQWDDPTFDAAQLPEGIYYNVHRWYSPATGRYTRPDPLGQRGGPNLYQYAAANPIRHSDPFGLSIYVCSRAAWGLFGVANHSYLWDDRDGVPPDERYCGVWSDAREQGPGVDACNYVPGSEGREDTVMQCCRFEKKHQGVVYIPFIKDCQTGTEKSLKCAGLLDNSPGIPGGRLGLPCDECSIAPPPAPPSDPPAVPGLFGSGAD